MRILKVSCTGSGLEPPADDGVVVSEWRVAKEENKAEALFVLYSSTSFTVHLV